MVGGHGMPCPSMACYSVTAHAENSEVLPFGSVAVTVIELPGFWAAAGINSKSASPWSSVTMMIEPRSVSPSPKPESLQSVLAKNSSVNEVFGPLFRLPVTVVLSASVTELAISGAFCKLFAPVSASPASFGVTHPVASQVNPETATGSEVTGCWQPHAR